MSMTTTTKLTAAGGFIAAMVVGVQPATAVDNGPTVTGDICMQQVFVGPTGTVANKNTLNCTAGDIRIARAIRVNPDSCIEGTTFDLEATFLVDVTANARYDGGFFFRTDGGDTARGDVTADGGVDGTCSLSGLTPNIPPALDLDGDTCGDLNSGSYEVTFTIPDVSCVGVTDPDNPDQKILKLPNCTSWHSNQGTACTISDPFSTEDAFFFDPDTKSKCVCDDDFTVPVIVETATITTTKTASPTKVPETGQDVTYTVMVTNDATFVSVELTTLNDVPFGDLTDSSNTNIMNSNCGGLVGVVLGPGESVMCTFQVFTSGDAGETIMDTATVCGDQTNTGEEICDDDDAIVTIEDVVSTPALTKTPTASATAACTLEVDVTYQVGISNPSTVDTLTVNDLTDDKFGDITLVQGDIISTTCVPDLNPATCEVGGTIAPSSSCSCSFTASISGGIVSGDSCTFSHDDTVTGNVTDDDDVTSTPSDSATLNVSADVNVAF